MCMEYVYYEAMFGFKNNKDIKSSRQGTGPRKESNRQPFRAEVMIGTVDS